EPEGVEICRADVPVAVAIEAPAARRNRAAGSSVAELEVAEILEIDVAIVVPVRERVVAVHARHVGGAVGVVAVDLPVAIVVDALVAPLRRRAAAVGRAMAIRISTVDERIPVIVDAVRAELLWRRAARATDALGVAAVGEPVAVVVDAVAADLLRGAGRI